MSSGRNTAVWSGRIHPRMTRCIFKQPCFTRGFPNCSNSPLNSAPPDCAPSGQNCSATTSAKWRVPGNPLNEFSTTLKGVLPLLPPATEKVWNYLREQSALAGFILAGGSALSLLIRHRLSEDLDFIFLQPRLPRQRLAVLCQQAATAGFGFKPNDDEAAIQ